METIGKTSGFHTFHDFWNYGLTRFGGSTAPRISEEALYITKMVEKVGLANIFHTSGLENVARPTFSTFSTNLSGSLINHENSGKSWPGQLFPHFGPGKRGQANFFHFFPRIFQEIL